MNVVGLYPGTPHDASLKALQEKLKNYYFEFDSCIKEQVTGTVIGTKFTPTYPS